MPSLTRTFLAVYPDDETHRRIVELLIRFRRRFPGIRWSPDEQLHFTLRFFGDLDDGSLERTRDVLSRLAPGLLRPSFPMNGLGAFPDWRRPRVLWIGAGAGGEELEALARRLDLAFGEAGLGRADKPFAAHLTIGRIRDGSRVEARELEAIHREPFVTPPLSIPELRLMASELSPRGARHTLIQAWSIGS